MLREVAPLVSLVDYIDESLADNIVIIFSRPDTVEVAILPMPFLLAPIPCRARPRMDAAGIASPARRASLRSSAQSAGRPGPFITSYPAIVS
jgi:hypothetical protein